jgi:hypothetical protein
MRILLILLLGLLNASPSLAFGMLRGAAAANVPLVLDAVPCSSSAAAAYGMVKLRAAYAGSAIEMRATVSSVSTTQDIGFSGNNLDAAAAAAFAATADPGTTVDLRFYDQCGNGNHSTFVSGRVGAQWFGTTINGHPVASWDQSSTPYPSTTGGARLQVPSAVALNMDAFSMFRIGRTTSTYPVDVSTFMETASPRVTLDYAALSSLGYSAGYASGGSVAFGFAVSSPSLTGLVVDATTMTAVVNAATASGAKGTKSATSAGGFLGWSAAGVNYGGNDALAFLFYNRTLNSTELDTLRAATWAIIGNIPVIADRLVFITNSIGEGTDVVSNEIFPELAWASISKQTQLFCDCIGGNTSAIAHTTIARDQALFNASATNNVAVIYHGINGLTASGGNAEGARVIQLCTDMRAAGFKAIVSTNVRAANSHRAFADQQAMNTYIQNNWSGNCDALVDPWSDASTINTIGSNANTGSSTYYVQTGAAAGLHLTRAGQAVLAPLFTAAINSLLQ